MQRFTGGDARRETGCQNVSSLPPPVPALFRRCFSSRVPAVNVLPLCISSMFTSGEIIHNGPSERLIHKNICSLFSCAGFRFHACFDI